MYFLFILLLIGACQSGKKISTTHSSTNLPPSIVDLVTENEPRFNSAYFSKIDVSFTENGEQKTINVTCKIKKDSAIYISVQPFMEIEAFKMELLPNSIRFFDKNTHEYYITDYNYLSYFLGIQFNYYDLQAIISNQFFCTGKADIQQDSCKIISTENNEKTISFANYGMHQNTEIDAKNRIKKVKLLDLRSNHLVNISYEKFIPQKTIFFPQEMKVEAKFRNQLINYNFVVQKVDFNSSFRFVSSNVQRFSQKNIDLLLKKMVIN